MRADPRAGQAGVETGLIGECSSWARNPIIGETPEPVKSFSPFHADCECSGDKSGHIRGRFADATAARLEREAREWREQARRKRSEALEADRQALTDAIEAIAALEGRVGDEVIVTPL